MNPDPVAVPVPPPRQRVLQRMLFNLALIIGGFLLLYAGALFLLQRKLIYFPRDYPVNYGMTLGTVGGTEIVFETPAGRQTMFYLPPRDNPDAPPQRLWVLFGGNGSLALDWLDIAETAARQGPTMGFLLVDYPGYGNCAGAPSRTTILHTLDAVMPALARHLDTPVSALEADLNVLGHSLGAATALEFATRHPVRSALLVSPFTSLLDMARRQVFWPMMHLLRDRFDNRARLSELATRTPRPQVHIFHGEQDDIVPFAMGRELATLHPDLVAFHPQPTLDHNWILDALKGDLARRMAE
jgi:pimeloyl-ACP methyl ester carboxylesterase